MSKIEVISDLSNKKLCEIPKYILDMTNLKMLYLEGNDIEVIPDDIFIALKRIVWLDLRKNQLKTVPKTIAFHPSLETLLLRDNNIEKLPLELGLVPNLKVMQVSGNPLTYPRKEIIQEGVKSITDFLRKEYESNHQLLENNPCVPDVKCVVNERNIPESDVINRKKDTEQSSKMYKPILKLKNYRKDSKCSFSIKNHKIRGSFSKLSGLHKDHPHYNSSRCLNMLSKKKNDIRVEEQNHKDVWLKKLSEIMATQEQVLQKQKDIETLKMWRQNLKYKSQNKYDKYDARKHVPYDYDETYDRMLTRKELNSNMSVARKVRKSSSKMKPPNVDKIVGDIMESLQLMTKDRNLKRSPRAQMEKAGRDIKKIVELQKRLSMLKLVITKDI